MMILQVNPPLSNAAARRLRSARWLPISGSSSSTEPTSDHPPLLRCRRLMPSWLRSRANLGFILSGPSKFPPAGPARRGVETIAGKDARKGKAGCAAATTADMTFFLPILPQCHGNPQHFVRKGFVRPGGDLPITRLFVVGKVLTRRLHAGRVELTDRTPHGRGSPKLDDMNNRPGRGARAGFFVLLA